MEHLVVVSHWYLGLEKGWKNKRQIEQGNGFLNSWIYTHNFLMSTRLYIYAVDLNKPTERVEKHINTK